MGQRGALMSEDAFLPLSLMVMIIALMVSIIPFVPGPIMMWGLALIFAFLNDFERITIPALVLITLLMLAGSTSEIWLRWLGMKTQGTSCWAALGSMVGGIIGTGIFPVVGTAIGVVVGALVVEFMRLGEMQEAWRAGRAAFKVFLLNLVVEFTMSTGILVVFTASIVMTA